MDLLDTIAAACGSMYISDLSYAQLKSIQPSLLPYRIEKIPASAFPATQWQDAHLYMTGIPFPCADAAACRRSLLSALERLYLQIQ